MAEPTPPPGFEPIGPASRFGDLSGERAPIPQGSAVMPATSSAVPDWKPIQPAQSGEFTPTYFIDEHGHLNINIARRPVDRPQVGAGEGGLPQGQREPAYPDRLPNTRLLPDPREFDLSAQLPQLPPLKPAAEIRNPAPRPGPYLEGRLDEAPITPGHVAAMTGAIPAGVAAGVSALNKANENWPQLQEAASEIGGDIAGFLKRGTVTTSAEAEGLPHERWYQPNGQMKIGPESSQEDVRSLQAFLKGMGDYQGPIDGRWKTQTAGAARAYGDRLAGQQAQEADRAKAEAEGKKAEAAKAVATASSAATTAAEKENVRKQADALKFGDFSEKYRKEHWMATFAKEHPTAAMMMFGVPSFATSLVLQRGLAGKFSKADEELAKDVRGAVRRAGKADISKGAGRGERASELNWVWDKGGAEELPFVRKGAGWKHNPNAPEASQLNYDPSVGTRLGREGLAAVLTGGAEAGIESYAGSSNLEHWEGQLKKSNAELAKGYTDERAKDVLDAENTIEWLRALQRAAYGAGAGGVVGGAKGMILPSAEVNTLHGLAERHRSNLADEMAKKTKRK